MNSYDDESVDALKSETVNTHDNYFGKYLCGKKICQLTHKIMGTSSYYVMEVSINLGTKWYYLSLIITQYAQEIQILKNKY